MCPRLKVENTINFSADLVGLNFILQIIYCYLSANYYYLFI